ncbi:MAG TPA: ABC transporter ATP-binding protein [Thermomicrobiales bacterium]|nr:ABC transporter ATP-binding protein [Thermomicrobiales bacterium]
MGFIMEGLDAESYDRTYDDRGLIERILRYFKPNRRAMGLIVLMIVLNSAMDALLPVLISSTINQIDGAEEIFGPRIWFLFAAILVAGAFAWVFNYVRQSRSAQVVGDVVLRLRNDAFRAVMRRDMSFFDEQQSGRIVSRVTSDTDDFANVVTLTLNLASQLLLLVFVATFLFYRNWKLALIALAIAPVIMAVALGFRKIARSTSTGAQRAMANVNKTIQETMRGISVAKNFRQEDQVYREFDEVNRQAYAVTLRQGYIYSGIFPILFIVSGFGTVAILYFGGRMVVDGSMRAGDWYLFLQVIALFWLPLTSIASFWSQFQQGLSASERVFALIDAPPRVVQIDDQPLVDFQGEIEFRNVDFAYVDGQPVLRNFSLHIEPGEMIALVGHTGAGKSTLGKLIARFYEFQGGQILLDGKDIRTFDLQSLRRQIGMVPQTPFLFSGTVAENIRYPRREATDAEVEEAARRIGGGDWLDVLQNGLQTEVGEQGRALSMGQRQLVALARLLIQRPRIIILDEATASVDPLTETQIQEGLDTVLAGRTSIAIAHRLVTVRHANRIIVLDHGRIVEQGSHDELMTRGGHYSELYNTYFRHQSPDYRPPEIESPELPPPDPHATPDPRLLPADYLV